MQETLKGRHGGQGETGEIRKEETSGTSVSSEQGRAVLGWSLSWSLSLSSEATDGW